MNENNNKYMNEIADLVDLAHKDSTSFDKKFREKAEEYPKDFYQIFIPLFFDLLKNKELNDNDESIAFKVFNRVENFKTSEGYTLFCNHIKEISIDVIEKTENLERLEKYIKNIPNCSDVQNEIGKEIKKRKKKDKQSLQQNAKPLKKNEPVLKKDRQNSQSEKKSTTSSGENPQKTKPLISFDEVFNAINRIRADYDNLKKNNEFYQGRVKRLESENSTKDSTIEKLRKDLRQKDFEINELNKKKTEISQQKEFTEKNLRNEIEKKEEVIKQIDSDCAALKNANNYLKKEKEVQKEAFVQELGRHISVRYKNYVEIKDGEDNEIEKLRFVIEQIFEILENNNVPFKE